MWDAVRKIFHHDDTPDIADPRDAGTIAPPDMSRPGMGMGDDHTTADALLTVTPSPAATSTQAGEPLRPAPDAVSTRAGATQVLGDGAPDVAPLSPAETIPSPAATETVRVSPPDHAPQGLAAEASMDSPSITSAATGLPPSAGVATGQPASGDTTTVTNSVEGGEQRATVDGREDVAPPLPAGVEAAPGEVVVTTPSAETPALDASRPAPPEPSATPITALPSLDTAPALGAMTDTGSNAGAPTAAIDEADELRRRAGTAAENVIASGSQDTEAAAAPQREQGPPDAGAPVRTQTIVTPTAAVEDTVVTPTAAVEDAAPSSLATSETPTARAPITLAPGTVVAGRYTIVGLVDRTDEEGETRTYRATDGHSYERCWSCGSAQNGPANRFCQNCGAPIQDHPVALAQTGAPTGLPDEVEHEGVYLHVQPERRLFGAEGIGIEVGAHSAEGPHHPNEDSYWYTTRTLCANSGRGSMAVAVLADGMGGYAPGSGLISSRIAATTGASIVGALDAHGDAALSSGETEFIVRAAIAAANAMVLEEIARSGDMGATLVGAVVHGDTAYIANVGDSRAYYVNPQGQATRITRDQSLVAQEIGQSGLSEDDIYTAPGNNIILHAVGEEQVETAADWYAQPIEPDSLLILCSDGYWKTMRGTVIPEGVSRESATLNDVARRMVDEALAQGSDDNTTVLLIAIS